MNDTIAAISTTLGSQAISIIRISGNDSISIINSIFKGNDLSKVKSHTINYGYIINNNEIIDEVLVSIMKAPKTFTREDIVEINCHGGIAVTNKILELLLNKGCRLAEPGEFTKRAFLNGRIDLTQAESVMDIINSENESQRKNAISGIEGNLSKKIKTIRQEILELLANIEVNIDYPEYEDAIDLTNNLLKPKVEEITDKLNTLIVNSENNKIIKTGIKTIIIGKPNVGKSSILNKLIDEDKAIVTNIAGTTRDIVEGKINLDGITLNIIDTAGIRKTDNVVEQIGVEKSLNLIEEADLILCIFNNNEEIDQDDLEILDKIKDKTSIIVINKEDLDNKFDISKINNENIIYTNTLSLDGIDTLKEKIKELFNLDLIKEQDYTYLSNARQISLAKDALSYLKEVKNSCDLEIPTDILEIDIKRAWNKLGEIIGETYEEELLDQLFSQFCLGK